jgi:hypothetical protein
MRDQEQRTKGKLVGYRDEVNQIKASFSAIGKVVGPILKGYVKLGLASGGM